MRIIPAIDIMNGKCVRLTQGNFDSMKVYKDNPVSVALEFQDANLEYLHVVDLDGAKKGQVVNWNVLEQLQEKTALLIDFGGGVKTTEDVERLLSLDISQINVGSIAIKEPDTFINWLEEYGAENFILSADVIDENVMIQGWLESSNYRLFDLIQQFAEHGLQFVTCTDIKTDGMLKGPNFDLYKKLKSHFPQLNITASGGISSLQDLKDLEALQLYGAIIGKALYEGKIILSDLKK
jgi:phosphoribosylformimino-5-aminoimidazole carboxamide ribotide isomerase